MKSLVFFLSFYLFSMHLSAQTTHVITISIPGAELEKSLKITRLFLGTVSTTLADTTRWRKPRNREESVFYFSVDAMSSAQKELRTKLLGFFYNPKIVQYKNKFFVLNQKEKLYKHNDIPLIYRKIVNRYYQEVNDSIKKWRTEKSLDEKALVDEFNMLQHRFCRHIIE